MPSPLRRRPIDRTLLGRILADPELLPQVRALPAPAFRQAILQVGLEDAGELVALASLGQLREVLDEDLWRSPRPGQDEAFDGPRFALWLEVLLEAGGAFVADRLAELSEDFVVFAFSRLVRVIDTTALAASITDADEANLLDKTLDSHLCQELYEYLIVSRVEDGWDAVWTTLLALDERHAALLREVLHRCWLATQEQVDRAGGLHAALNDGEQLLEDARAEREDRRAESGYVSPADARAFLALASQPPESPEHDPITRAHFRHRSLPAATSELPPPPPGEGRSAPLRRLLAAAGVEPPATTTPAPALSPFRQALGQLLAGDPPAYQRVVDELAYLANALVAGDASRAWAPAEAAEHVLSACDTGLRLLLERSPAADDPTSPPQILRHWGAVGLFRIAWSQRQGPT